MNIYDPIYGSFSIPEYLVELINTHEVKRLSQIRLSNSISPSLATLGELRRYSHTLGVLYLSLNSPLSEYTLDEKRAFYASALLHDIGTAPFAHIFEYHLKDLTEWNHEDIVEGIILGQATPENKVHQIYGYGNINFKSTLQKATISIEIVKSILSGDHPLSILLFGGLDLDNIDNVYRMSWALGLTNSSKNALELSKALGIDCERNVCLLHSKSSLIEDWATKRKYCYEKILFDGPNIAAQAVMFDTIGNAIDKKIISQSDWDLTDEQLLDILGKHPDTKENIIKWYLCKSPKLLFIIQISGSINNLSVTKIKHLKKKIEQIIDESYPTVNPLAYVFVDSGTFQKRLNFIDLNTKKRWFRGEKSESIILYGFSKTNKTLSRKKCEKVINNVIEKINVNNANIINIVNGLDNNVFYGQRKFAF